MNDRRHELQTNELAVYLQKVNQSIEPYSKPIAVAVGLLIVGGIAWGLYNSKVSGDRSDATLQLIQAVGSSSAEQLANVHQTYPETAAAAWSRLYEGNAHLADGLRSLYLDREDAELRLGDARAAFDAALASSDDRLLRSRASFGLARVAESLGELELAIEAYRKCIEANESEAMVEQAQSRIDALSKPQAKEFLAWFSEQDFKPADPSLPPSLPSEKTLPDLPDLNLPTLGDKLGGGEASDEMKLEDGDGLALPDEEEVEAKKKSDAADSAESTDAPKESTDAPEKSTDAPEESTDAPEKSTDAPEESTDAPEESTDASKESAESETPADQSEATAPDTAESAESSDANKE